MLGGCPGLSSLATLQPETTVDFVQLKDLSDKVLDLTDFNWGFQTADYLYATYADASHHLELMNLPDMGSTYMLLTNTDLRTQTVFLPGTASIDNIKLDLQTAPVPDEELGISLHQGFRAMALAIRGDLLPRLHPDCKLTIVGYSLGGGAAVILSLYLVRDGVAIDRVLTLGQPVVTNAAGAEAFADLPLLRLIAGDDPIPRMRDQDYTQFGEALILLDGPYIVHLSAAKPDIDLATSLVIDSTDVVFLDHGSYRQRIASKVGVEVLDVRMEDHEAYLVQPPVP